MPYDKRGKVAWYEKPVMTFVKNARSKRWIVANNGTMIDLNNPKWQQKIRAAGQKHKEAHPEEEGTGMRAARGWEIAKITVPKNFNLPREVTKEDMYRLDHETLGHTGGRSVRTFGSEVASGLKHTCNKACILANGKASPHPKEVKGQCPGV